MTDALTRAGELSAARAEELWQLDVYDPPKGDRRPRAAECLQVIEGIIKRAGWGFATPYLGNGSPQWCGMFAADCWRAGGLDPAWFPSYWASTYRLRAWATYHRFSSGSKANPPPLPGVTERRLYIGLDSPFAIEPRLGDVVIVGDGRPGEGDHITINMGYDAPTRTFDTISGNGGGVGPRGNSREGISRRGYAIGAKSGYRPLWLVRPVFDDLVAEAQP